MVRPSVNGRYGTTGQRRRASALRFELYNAFWDSGTAATLSRLDSLVWLAMYRHARPDRTVCISAGRLAEIFKTHRQTIVRSIGHLRRVKLLIRVRRGGPDGTPTTYRIRPYDPGQPSES